MLGQCELAAWRTQAIDYLNRDDIRRTHCVFTLRHVLVYDLVQLEHVPEPSSYVYVAEVASIGPAHRAEPNAYDIWIIWQSYVGIVWIKSQLLRLTLSIVQDHSALPAELLVMFPLSEVGDRQLPRPRIGPYTLDQRIISMRLAILGFRVRSKEHDRLLGAHHGKEHRPDQGDRSSLHAEKRFSLQKIPRNTRSGPEKFVK